MADQRFIDFYTAELPENAVCALTFFRGKAQATKFMSPQQLRQFTSYPDLSDAYIRTTVLRNTPTRGRGKKEDTLGSAVIWVDFDYYKIPGNTFDSAVAQLRALEPSPSCIVSSGQGLQAWWKLREFSEDLVGIETASHKMSDALKEAGGDHCYDLTRILRIPGSLSYKKDPPLEVQIVELNDHVYDLADFGLPKEFSLETLPQELRDRILSEATALAAGAPEKGAGRVDRSRNDAWIATKLLAGGYDVETVEMVLKNPEWFSGSHFAEKRNQSYVDNTIRTAQQFLKKETLKNEPWIDISDKGRVTFFPTRLAGVLLDTYPTLTVGGLPHIYRDGVFRPDGSGLLTKLIQELLKETWKLDWETATMKWLISHTIYEPPMRPEHPDIINVLNGLLSIHDHSLTPHSPAEKSFVQLPVTFDESAQSQRVLDFVAEIIAEDAIPAFWEFMGCCLLPGYDYKKMLLLIGESNTGKSSIMNLIRRFLGEENTSSIPLQELSSTFSSAQLFGKLANICADLPTTTLEAIGLLKGLTGGDRINAQRKYGQPFEFVNSAKLISSTNDFASVAKPENAFFDRFLIIPCDHKFTLGTNAIINIVDTFTATDLSAFLNYALEGLDRLEKNHVFTKSASVDAKQQEFREVADNIEEFIQQVTHRDQNARLLKANFYDAYHRWCTRSGHIPVTSTRFFRRINQSLERYGMQSIYSMLNESHEQRYMYVGRALDEAETFEDGLLHLNQPL